MPPNYLTSGYTPKLEPVTPLEAVNRQSQAHIKTVAKNAVLNHLRSFLDPAGRNRKFTEQLCPDALKFVLEDFQVTAATAAENKVRVPVYKFTADIQSYLPAIVLNDTGIQFKSPGLGFDQGNVRVGEKQVCRIITVLRTITLNMLLASQDQTTTDSMVDVVALIFGELSGLTSGMALSGSAPGEHWLVRFPKIPELGSSERANVGDDGKDMIWTSNTTFQIEYEDSFLVPFEEPEWTINKVPPGGMPKRTMTFPSLVRVGHDVSGNVRYQRTGDVIVVADPRIARLRLGERPGQYYVRGLKPGTTSIRVVNNNEFTGGVHAHTVDSVDIEVRY